VAPELELVDHQPVEQADDVGARADHVALVGERSLEGAGAAEAAAVKPLWPSPTTIASQSRPASAASGSGRPTLPSTALMSTLLIRWATLLRDQRRARSA
jgi:hypothetical protein